MQGKEQHNIIKQSKLKIAFYAKGMQQEYYNGFFQQRSSPPDVFVLKGVLKIFRNFIGEKLCKSVISMKMQCNFIEIALLREYNKNTSGGLLQLVTPKQPTSKWE